MTTKTVRFICRACNGTGRSRYREYSDCDACDGFGTVAGRLTLSAPTERVLRSGLKGAKP